MSAALVAWLMTLLLTCELAASQDYFRIRILGPGGQNMFNLRCRVRGMLGNVEDYEQAQWLYNGSNYTNSSCFSNAIRAGSSLQFNLTAECDGYLQCGNDTVYSAPFQTTIFPSRTPDYQTGNIDVRKRVGSSVTLNCHVIVSATDSYSVEWLRLDRAGNTHPVPTAPNSDYSLMLNNLSLSITSNVFYCRVRRRTNPAGSLQGQAYQLTVLEYIPPEIEDLRLTEDNSNRLSFTVTAIGSGLNYFWHLFNDTKTIATNNQSRTFSVAQERVTTQSKLIVNVSSTDVIDGQIRSDSITAWLYPVVTTTPSTTLPIVSVQPSSDPVGINENMVYYGCAAGGAFLVAFILVLIITIIGLILCIRLQSNDVFTDDDLECVAGFTEKMTLILSNALQHENTDPVVKDEIWRLFGEYSQLNRTATNRIATDGEPMTTDSTSIVVPLKSSPTSPQRQLPNFEPFVLSEEHKKVIAFLKKHRPGTLNTMKNSLQEFGTTTTTVSQF